MPSETRRFAVAVEALVRVAPKVPCLGTVAPKVIVLALRNLTALWDR